LLLDDSFHHSIEHQADILETFGHSEIVVDAKRCNEACLLFVFFMELYFVVSRETV
jgi:hypothetical protein